MAVTTIAVAVAVGATAMAAKTSKDAAKKAGKAFEGVGQGIEKVDLVEASVNQFLGGNMDRSADDNRYKVLQDLSYTIVKDQMDGKLSAPTQRTLSMRAAETGANIGTNAVGDLNTGYLGLAQEAQVQQGWSNYRAMFGQLAAIGQQQQANNYQMQANAAGVQAQSILAQGQAMAGMWQGIASIAGGVAGGGFGAGGGGGGGGGMGGWASMASNFMGGMGGGGGGGGGQQASMAYYQNMNAAGRNTYGYGPYAQPSRGGF